MSTSLSACLRVCVSRVGEPRHLPIVPLAFGFPVLAYFNCCVFIRTSPVVCFVRVLRCFSDLAAFNLNDTLLTLNLILSCALSQIVFSSKKRNCDKLAQAAWDRGFAVDSLHGDREQWERTKVMDQYRSGEVRLLVATDVAARGLDVKDISYVINYDFPVDGVEVRSVFFLYFVATRNLHGEVNPLFFLSKNSGSFRHEVHNTRMMSVLCPSLFQKCSACCFITRPERRFRDGHRPARIGVVLHIFHAVLVEQFKRFCPNATPTSSLVLHLVVKFVAALEEFEKHDNTPEHDSTGVTGTTATHNSILRVYTVRQSYDSSSCQSSGPPNRSGCKGG